MSRVISFRRQTRRKGEKIINYAGDPCDSNWVYGSVMQGLADHSIIYTGSPDYSKKPVYTDTLSQLVVDDEDFKIYEGDIIKVAIEGESIDGFPAKISYQNYLCDFDKDTLTFGFRYIDDEEGLVDDIELWNYLQEISLNIWVIGNKWDNPELLKGEKK